MNIFTSSQPEGFFMATSDDSSQFNDATHHQHDAILPLLKWYQATLNEQCDVSALWERHLTRCQTLCLPCIGN